MSQQNHNDGRYKGRRSRGKEKQEEPFVLTLDEWEKKKAAGVKPLMRDELHDVRRDEDLAWQLQNQFDLEDANVSTSSIPIYIICYITIFSKKSFLCYLLLLLSCSVICCD